MIEELEPIALLARRVLQDALIKCCNKENKKGACLYGAHLTHTMISRFTEMPSIVKGGDGLSDGGYFSAGAGHGHYWVEVKTPMGICIVDITADQFGGPPIEIRLRSEAKEYISGDQDVVNSHYGRFIAEIGAISPCNFNS